MTKLTPGDLFALEAFSGWLMLGNTEEAVAELRQIPAERAIHPTVFLAVWELHACLRQWAEAAGAADFVIAMAPHWPDGYVKRAFALHELKRTKEAWQCLLPASRKFTKEWVIPYNLACYSCQLKRLEIAAKWFKRALKIGDKARLKAMAMTDPDLEALRPRIAKLAREIRAERRHESKIL